MMSMAEAAEAGMPECFSGEFALLERSGQLPPSSYPVFPDYGSDAYDPYMDDRYEPDHDEEPLPEEPTEPVEELKLMPLGREGHHPWCDVDHAPVLEHCPPPF
jgi:hypothetical protein